MPSQSKEENIIRLILENSPLTEWHFEEIMKEAKISRAVANKWLGKYMREGLIKKIKEQGRFSYFTVGKDNKVYSSLKRVYALEQLHKVGLIPALLSLDSAKTIILFGSMAKGDWYKDSDIDIFLLGKAPDFDRKLYEERLGKNIELHVFANRKEIDETRTGLMKNVINGLVIKGGIQDIAEVS